jgi:trehalose 6-phosphate phosphatase
MDLQRTALPAPPMDLLQHASLFLDFDGTLVELAAQPDGVSVEDRLHDLLARLSIKLEGRIAIISGRPAAQVRKLFRDPPFAIAGSHGHELYWPDGRIVTPTNDGQHDSLLTQMRQLEDRHPGLIVEDKPFGVALHYRLAPQAGDDCIHLAKRLATEKGYQLQTGKMVVELMLPGADKGEAVIALLSQAPMAGARPIFVGDDDTDEAGFRMATRLGGAGILVGAPRATAAVFGLDDVDATLRWLEAAGGAAP